MIKISLENGTSINIDTRNNEIRSQEGFLTVIGGLSLISLVSVLIHGLYTLANSNKIRKIIENLPPEEKKKVLNYSQSLIGEVTKLDKEIMSKGLQILKKSEKIFKYSKFYDEKIITDYSGESAEKRRQNLQTNNDTKNKAVISFLKRLVSLSKNAKTKVVDYDIFAHIEYQFVVKDYYYDTEHEDENDVRNNVGREWNDSSTVNKFLNDLHTGTKQMFNSIKGNYNYLVLEYKDPEIEEYESFPYKNTEFDGFKAVGTMFSVYLDSKKLKEAMKPVLDKL